MRFAGLMFVCFLSLVFSADSVSPGLGPMTMEEVKMFYVFAPIVMAVFAACYIALTWGIKWTGF